MEEIKVEDRNVNPGGLVGRYPQVLGRGSWGFRVGRGVVDVSCTGSMVESSDF